MLFWLWVGSSTSSLRAHARESSASPDSSPKLWQEQDPLLSNEIEAANSLVEEARTLLAQPSAASQDEGKNKLLAALEVFKRTNYRIGEAEALKKLALLYTKRKLWRDARSCYERALVLYQEMGDLDNIGTIYYCLARVYNPIGESQLASESYEQALRHFRLTGNTEREALVLLLYASDVANGGGVEQAQRMVQEAVELCKSLNNEPMEVMALSQLAQISLNKGEAREAINQFKNLLPRVRQLNNLNFEANILSNTGLALIGLGDPRMALSYLEEASKIFLEINSPDLGACYLNMGQCHLMLGDKQSAYSMYRKAASFDNSDGWIKASVLYQMGELHLEVGEDVQAMKLLTQAQEQFTKNPNPQIMVRIHIAFGKIYALRREPEMVRFHYQSALSLAMRAEDEANRAEALASMGAYYLDQGEAEQALCYLEETLVVEESLGLKNDRAFVLKNLASAFHIQGDAVQAAYYGELALDLAQKIANPEAEIEGLVSLSQIYFSAGDRQAGLAAGALAIQLVEDARVGINHRRWRTSYLATRYHVYSHQIDLLMSMAAMDATGRSLDRAFATSERARGRSLIEHLQDLSMENTPQKGELYTKRIELDQQIAASERYRLELFDRESSEAERAIIEGQIEQRRSDLFHIENLIQPQSPKRGGRESMGIPTLADIQKNLLDDQTTMLQYVFGTENAYLWIVTKNRIESKVLGSMDEINRAAGDLFRVFNARNEKVAFEHPAQRSRRIFEADQNWSRAAASLSQMVIAPAAEMLTKKRLLVVADGALQIIPFELLVKAGPRRKGSPQPKLLLEDHEIIMAPAASVLLTLKRQTVRTKPFQKMLALVADPVFNRDDVRLNSPGSTDSAMAAAAQKFLAPHPNSEFFYPADFNLNEEPRRDGEDNRVANLPGTRVEAEAILRIVPRNQCLVAMGFDARRDLIFDNKLDDYRILHFATHAVLNKQYPERSALIFSLFDKAGTPKPGILTLSEIYQLHLSAELVVLSACQTAQGKYFGGEGLVGLTHGFMHAGVPKIVSSLWKVQDEPTAILMTLFYRAMFQQGLPPSQALREAKLTMRADARWASPYFWGGFTFQGLWD